MSFIGMQESAAMPAQAGLAAWIKRHPLAAYFLLAFAGTWIVYLPILLSGRGLGLIELPDAAAFIIFILATYCGPFLAAFVITRVTDGPHGVRRLLRRMVQWRTGLRWYLLVLIGYPLVFGVPAVLMLGPAGLAAAAQNWPMFLSGYLVAILTGFLLPTLGEETGWRGFALPRLQSMMGPLFGSLLLGVMHALWHLPAYFVKGLMSSGDFDPEVFAANSLAMIAGTLVWTWLFNKADGSILFATYVHAASNGVSLQLPAALHVTAPDPWFAFKVMGVVAMAVILLTRGRLGYSERHQED